MRSVWNVFFIIFEIILTSYLCIFLKLNIDFEAMKLNQPDSKDII